MQTNIIIQLNLGYRKPQDHYVHLKSKNVLNGYTPAYVNFIVNDLAVEYTFQVTKRL